MEPEEDTEEMTFWDYIELGHIRLYETEQNEDDEEYEE